MIVKNFKYYLMFGLVMTNICHYSYAHELTPTDELFYHMGTNNSNPSCIDTLHKLDSNDAFYNMLFTPLSSYAQHHCSASEFLGLEVIVVRQNTARSSIDSSKHNSAATATERPIPSTSYFEQRYIKNSIQGKIDNDITKQSEYLQKLDKKFKTK
ncbi:hypothetical protein OAP56_02845 [Rickettsiaceae bacterium]|nr:hypothetical protein [Rickettsiaceae bacterium]